MLKLSLNFLLCLKNKVRILMTSIVSVSSNNEQGFLSETKSIDFLRGICTTETKGSLLVTPLLFIC